MHPTAKEDLLRLLQERGRPCISIYLPTHRSYPDRQQDSLRYQHLVDEAETKLRESGDAALMRPLIDQFRSLVKDDAFWTRRSEGLAVLGSPETFEVFDLQQAVPEQSVVSDSFHLKPLVRSWQVADVYHVLALQRKSVALFQGNCHQLDPLELSGVPLTAREALAAEVPPEPHQAEAEDNPPPGLSASLGDAKMELDRFYRVVDQAVFDRVSRESQAPLVLAGLPELQATFRSISRSPHLVPNGIAQGPPARIDDAFIAKAWKCVEPHYQRRIEQIVNDFHIAHARGMATDDLQDIAQAIARDRVGILLIETDRMIPGRFDAATCQLTIDADLDLADDVLDDFAETVLRTDGTAIVLAKETMPTTSGAAAIFRF